MDSQAAARTKKTSRPSEAIDHRFVEVIGLIESARTRAFQAVNSELVELYWKLGEYISKKIASAEWGDGVVDELASALSRRYAGLRGFARRNLFRMRQFYEAYADVPIVSALLTQLPWSHHMAILGQAKASNTRQFYIATSIKEGWTLRELERQIRSGAVLRTVKTGTAVSSTVTRAPQQL